MDSPAATPTSVDETPRVKFLCSFSGSILPRPQDGQLRYVGGETRIVSVPREITYEELIGKMRELLEGATLLKYQQPDEDLDALVSVVNDDDVTNMMEEYDKLGSSDGFTRLRIFLFVHPDQEIGLHFGDGDERRYVDALNSLNDSPEFRKQNGESLVMGMGSFDDFSQMSLEGSFHGQRNMELPMNLRHLTIPRLGGSGQPPVTQRYSEMEAPWSPGYYSPRQPVGEFPTSPSSSRYRTPYGEFPEDYNLPPVSAHSMYEQKLPSQYPDNMVLVPAGPAVNEKSGFPGNILQGPGVYEGNSICDHCRIAFQRNPVYPPESQLHLEPSNGFVQVPNSCAECPPNMHHPTYYSRDHNDTRGAYPRTHCHERGWVSPHQPNPWVEEPRPHSYVLENGLSVREGHYGQSPYYGSQVFQDQGVATGSQIHHPSIGNPGYAYVTDNNPYQVPHAHAMLQNVWRNIHVPLQGGPTLSYESSQIVNGSVHGPGFSPRVQNVVENQNPWAESSQKIAGLDGSLLVREHSVNLMPNTHSLENCHPSYVLEPVQSEAGTSKDPFTNSDPPLLVDDTKSDANIIKSLKVIDTEGSKGVNHGARVEDSAACGVINQNSDALAPSVSIKLNAQEPVIENGGSEKVEESNASTPKLITSVKEADSKAEIQKSTDTGSENLVAKENAQNDTDRVDDHVDLELDSDHDNVQISKIEPTKAEAEAIDQGLQTIKNEDLEEIRELGSGTYGAVFHGKWKGSDVAIKRIKASCFAGRPSERERLIADFWKEALILSSLHHPNVVSFYGVVRDGPDGSLATVTEFMVNGSLKQFLQKKDRTIDRRKRLIIGMDTAFGMEYLHGKNIVHFDLKCENLLVNMRDPHRPVCKIGDLGLSKVKQQTLVSGGVRGTLPWMAPELLSGKSNMVSDKIDVYSFGIVMWELLTGDEPYTDMHCASIIGGIVNNTLRPQIPTWCDPEWKALMESCWASEPAQRPSFSEISQKLRNMAAAMNLK